MINFIIFVVILALLVLVHEFGHFIVAKKSGIRVDEFGLGFPPRIFGKKFGETEYTLNIIPFGGFVKIFGENPADEAGEPADLSRSMAHKSKWIQAAVLAAGVSFNVIFAWIIISIGLMFGLPTAVDNISNQKVTDAKVVITTVVSKSPAELAGLKPGDVLLSLKTAKTELSKSVTPDTVHDLIAESDSPISIEYSRGPKIFNTTVSAEKSLTENTRAIGISMDMVGTLKLPIHLAFIEGARKTGQLFVAVAVNIFFFLRDAVMIKADLTQVAGPVGMVALVGDAKDLGFSYLIFFTALLSINLAVINLIPFPALDGGRLFVLLIEAIKGSAIKPKFVNALNTVGFALLIILMLLVTFHDILKQF